MPYIECESYAHRYAKQTLADWFREKYQANKKRSHPTSYYIFDWLPQNGDGVYMEYPLLSRRVNDKIEVFGINKWSKYPTIPPTNPDIIVEGVLDVAICSRGKLSYGFEIVHKHKCGPKKISFLKHLRTTYGIPVYEISASWILDQIKRPPNLSLSLVG